MELKKRLTAGVITTLSFIGFAMTSCVDEEYDFENVSEQVEIGKSWALPTGNAEFTIGDLVDEYASHTRTGFYVTSINDTVVLEYDTVFYIPNIKLKTSYDEIHTVNYCFMDDLPDGCRPVLDDPYLILQAENDTKAGFNIKIVDVKDNTGKVVTYNQPGVLPVGINSNVEIHNRPQGEGTTGISDMLEDKNTKHYYIRLQLSPNADPSEIDDLIPVDGVLAIRFKFIMPICFLKNTYLIYSDTIKDVEINDILDNEYVTKATIRFDVENRIPMAVDAEFTMLDGNFNTIPCPNSTSTDGAYHYLIPKSKTKNGVTTDSTHSVVRIEYDKNTIADLRKARNIRITVHVPKEGEVTDDATRVMRSNSIKFKGSLYTPNGINIE